MGHVTSLTSLSVLFRLTKIYITYKLASINEMALLIPLVFSYLY